MATQEQKYEWFTEPEIETQWLVDGLIPADGYSAIVGKPKAGKSTVLRNLVVAVIKGHPFLGRAVELPPGTGKVLYIHLDRKDQPAKVAAELRKLGITKQESPRMIMRLAQHLPSNVFEERLEWLKKEVEVTQPNLIVIDLLWQFVRAKSSNDYNAVLEGINALQDALIHVKYKGALIAAVHGRKATNPNDQFDDFLGSTGQRGSFSTNIMLTQYRKEGLYTIISDQTERDAIFGEIPETTIVRNPDGTLSLGTPMASLVKEAKQAKSNDDFDSLVSFIREHPGCEMKDITQGLSMSNKYALILLERMPKSLLNSGSEILRREGKGHKGDPYRFSLMPSPLKRTASTPDVAPATKGMDNAQHD